MYIISKNLTTTMLKMAQMEVKKALTAVTPTTMTDDIWDIHYDMSLTMDHSRPRCVKVVRFLSSAHRAPMKDPMLVPHTMSMGMPASHMARIRPTCDRPLSTHNTTCHRLLTCTRHQYWAIKSGYQNHYISVPDDT